MDQNVTRAARAAHHKADPLTVSVATAKQVSGLGHTLIYQMISTGRLRSTKVGGKRLINYASLKELVGA